MAVGTAGMCVFARNILEAPPGFEPGMEVLQSSQGAGVAEQNSEFAQRSVTSECFWLLPDDPECSCVSSYISSSPGRRRTGRQPYPFRILTDRRQTERG